MIKNNIAILASGNGSNAENIIKYFKCKDSVNVQVVITNNPDADVIKRSEKLAILTHIISNHDLELEKPVLDYLLNLKIDFIILAGFLRKIPNGIISSFPDKIINIHPSLLPKYGGKGMYGIRVHKSVIESKENTSGITIHLVNEKYDEGKTLAQFQTCIHKDWTSERLQVEIHKLEKKHFPIIIEKYIQSFESN